MFGLFRKKKNSTQVTDLVFATRQAKWQALAQLVAAHPDVLLTAWFEDTADDLNLFLAGLTPTPGIVICRDLRKHLVNGRDLVFIEHHPSAEKESALHVELQLATAKVYSSLEEELFTRFGGEKLVSLMNKMGMPEDEAVSHPLVTRSIQNIQRKIDRSLALELPARNMKEWMQKNLRD